MAQTANYGFEKPSTEKNVDEEFYQLQETLDMLDSILAALQTAVNGKSAVGHTHAISDIVNLAAELAAKMPASATFKLDDLTDVDGADGAPNGYVLVKSALGWLPSSALAALGTHGHLISEITGLVDALAGKADAAATTTALAGKAALLSSGTSDNTFDDNDELAYVSGTTQKRGTFAGLITSIFNGTRALANGVFLAASFAWQNATGFKRTHNITGHTANRVTNWPNGDVTISAGTVTGPPGLSLTAVTGSRALGTVYQNTNTTPRVVTALTATNSIDVNIGPTTGVAVRIGQNGVDFATQFIVPSGWYYRISGANLTNWYEGQIE